MKMTSYLDGALKKYGNTVTYYKSGRTEAGRAFVQPLRRRHRLYINDRYIDAGYFDNRYLLYIGSPKHPLDSGEKVKCDEAVYTVVTSEVFSAHNEEIYVWAILMPVTDEGEDYYDFTVGRQD